MIKKSLIAALALGVAGTCADAKFMDGASAGLDLGYQFNKGKFSSNNISKSNTFDSPVLGAHFDFNKFISQTMYAGVGLEGSYAFKEKKVNVSGSAAGITSSGTVKLRRDFTGALTARLGTVMGPVAFDVNGALVATNYKAKVNGTVTKAGVTKNFSKSNSEFRFGFAPGIAVTTEVAKNVSVGLAYRYEIYSKKDGLKLDAHVVMAKVSYHF